MAPTRTSANRLSNRLLLLIVVALLVFLWFANWLSSPVDGGDPALPARTVVVHDAGHAQDGNKAASTLLAMPSIAPLPTISRGKGQVTTFPSLVCVPNPYIRSLTVRSADIGHVTRHRPAHIQKELDEIKSYGLERYVMMAEKGSNSEAVTQEDVARAEGNWIEALPAADINSVSCDVDSVPVFADQSPADLEALAIGMMTYNQLKDAVQASVVDGSPTIIDVGCVLGEVFARNAPTATVVCLHTGMRFATKPMTKDPPPNLHHLFARGPSLIEGDFSQFFDVCNFFTVVFVLGNLRRDLHATEDELFSLLGRILPSSALVYAAIPGKAMDRFAASAFISSEPTTLSPKDAESARLQRLDEGVRKNAAGEREKKQREFERQNAPPTPPRIDGLADKTIASTVINTERRSRGDGVPNELDDVGAASKSKHDDEANRVIVIKEYIVGKSSRSCRKTWNAPFVQWARSQSVHYDSGKVSFNVRLVQDSGRQVNEKLRHIHPLQYLHSLNLDTLLGAGLSEPVRMRLLGEMIATPRYSDPLPHNWVVANGGRVHRIDKVDAAYDSKVDERKGYWGRSTRGYLRLLTEHLCLPVAKDGSPSAFVRLEEECVGLCKTCIEQCSYLPKGTICTDCSKCGEECVRPLALTVQSVAVRHDLTNLAKVSTCQKTYSSMHAARKVWAKWEKEDSAGVAGGN